MLVVVVVPGATSLRSPIVGAVAVTTGVVPLGGIGALTHAVSVDRHRISTLAALSGPLSLETVASPYIDPISSVENVIQLSLVVTDLPSRSHFPIGFL